MERLILVLFIAVIIAVGISAGGGLLMGVGGDNWTPRAYVPANGDCFVPPQGDPLYDEHYAKEVNAYNCESFKDQSQAKFIDAQTDQVQTGTFLTRLGIGSMGLVIIAVVVLLALAVVRR